MVADIASLTPILASIVGQRRGTGLGSLREVNLQEAILGQRLLVAAHFSTVGPAALLSALGVRVPATGEKRLLLAALRATEIVARDTFQLADGGLRASVPGESLIACLI